MLGVTFLPISPGTVIDLILHPVGTAPFICIHLWLLNFFFFFCPTLSRDLECVAPTV